MNSTPSKPSPEQSTTPGVSSSTPGTDGDGQKPEGPPKKPPPPKTEPKYFIHSRRFLDLFVIMFALFTLAVTRFFRPGFWSTIMYAMVGLPIGLALSFLFYARHKDKNKVKQLFNVSPGSKGLEELVKGVPTWVTLAHSEKCEWINKVLLEMWPFYDFAVCEMVKEMVEPIFENIKPPAIGTLEFAKLQFGDAPIRVEAVRMDRERKDGVYLEMDVRWAGEPEVKLKVGVSAATLQPKVTNLRMAATVGIYLKPLVDEVPGFGALLVTLTKPPKVKYNIDTGGAVVGKVLGGGVEAFLDNLLPNILDGFLVWPQRIVVPILPENVTGPLTDLALRNQGILRVTVLEARDIPRMDKMGTSDSHVELFTDPGRRVSTKTKKNTLTPKWDDEIHFLMVQEPESQFLRFEMFDTDFVNAKQLLKVNVLKGASDAIHSKETMGKGQLDLRDLCVNHAGEEHEAWFPLGSDDWTADDGPGKDRGELRMKLTYVPLQRCNPNAGQYGAVFVYVRKGREFPRMVASDEDSCNPYYVVKIGKEMKTGVGVYNTTAPDWGNNHVAFYNISNTEEVRISFKHKGKGINIGADENLGYVTIDLEAVRQESFRHQRGTSSKEYELLDADSGYATIEVQYVPYF